MTADEKDALKDFVGDTLQRCHKENLIKKEFDCERIEDKMPSTMNLIYKRSKNMDYELIVPVKKVDGSEVKTVTVKESFTGRDIRAIGNLSWPVARPRLRRRLCGACWRFPLVL